MGHLAFLVMGGTSGLVDGVARINLATHPSPTVTAEGIGVVCIRGWQYWLEVTCDHEIGEAQPERTGPEARNP